MEQDLSYLNTTYARNKMIEEYNTPYVPKKDQDEAREEREEEDVNS